MEFTPTHLYNRDSSITGPHGGTIHGLVKISANTCINTGDCAYLTSKLMLQEVFSTKRVEIPLEPKFRLPLWREIFTPHWLPEIRVKHKYVETTPPIDHIVDRLIVYTPDMARIYVKLHQT